MPQGERHNYAPARTPSYCAAGDYGSADDPKTLIQVNAHRRHHSTPGCDAPPIVKTVAGGWVQAGDSARIDAQLQPAETAPVDVPAPESPSEIESPEPAPVDSVPVTAAIPGFEPTPAPAPRPSAGGGRASIPTTAPVVGAPPPPLIAPDKNPALPPQLYDMWEWDRRVLAVSSTFAEWLYDNVYWLHYHLIGYVPGMVPVTREQRLSSVVTGSVVDLHSIDGRLVA